MFFLALDCSTSTGGVALARGEDAGNLRIVRRMEFTAGKGRGGELFIALEQAMREVRSTDERLGGIVVGMGPGSFSGVRQSIAAAVGLAASTGAWLGGVPSVVAVRDPSRCYQVVGDARRGAFYHTAVQDGICVSGPELIPDAVALEARLAQRPDWPVRVMETALPGGLLADAPITRIDAGGLFAVPRETHRPTPLEPIYLRPVSITLPKPTLSAVP